MFIARLRGEKINALLACSITCDITSSLQRCRQITTHGGAFFPGGLRAVMHQRACSRVTTCGIRRHASTAGDVNSTASAMTVEADAA